MSDERLTEIEIKLAFLERSFGQLSDVVRGIGDSVDLLLQLTGRVQMLESKVEPAAPADEKPPHY